jgi:hypothetical protein
MIMETGYTQFDLEDRLLTNNLWLYDRFLKTKQLEDVFETVVNFAGLKHLMETKILDQMIEEWKARKCNISSSL